MQACVSKSVCTRRHPGFKCSTHIVGRDPDLREAAAVDGGLDHPVDERPARERLDVFLGDGHGAAARGDHRDDTRLGRHFCGLVRCGAEAPTSGRQRTLGSFLGAAERISSPPYPVFFHPLLKSRPRVVPLPSKKESCHFQTRLSLGWPSPCCPWRGPGRTVTSVTRSRTRGRACHP